MNYSAVVRSILIICLSTSSFLLKSANIIFDMDGVLVTQSRSQLVWEIGPTRLVGLFNPSPSRIEELLFSILDHMKPHALKSPCLFSKRGNRVPALMMDWLAGLVPGADIKQLLSTQIAEIAPTIDSQRKLGLVQGIADVIFTPDRLANIIIPLQEAVDLLKKCYYAKNPDGSRKNKIFIITNWDPASFRCLANDPVFADFLDLVDDMVVSGFVHMVKPDQAIFIHAFKQFCIDPANELTIYIDDSLENLAGAQSLNLRMLRTIHCKDLKFSSVKKKLKQFEVF